MKKENRVFWAMSVMALIIVILLGVIVYAFVIKPNVDEFLLEKQVEAYNQGAQGVLNNILGQLQEKGRVDISDAQGNSITLMPVQPGVA